MANQTEREQGGNTEKKPLETIGASTGEEVRTPAVTGGTNGGTSNRPDYEPEKEQIKPGEPGGTESHAASGSGKGA